VKILILTDSLSIPREEFKEWEKLYISLLKKRFPNLEFIYFAFGKATTSLFVQQVSRYYKYIEPDIVILQCGIVDCTPRFLKQIESQIINKLKLNFIFNDKVKTFIRKHRNYCYVKPVQYEDNIMRLKKFFPKADFFTIGILPANDAYEKKIEGISAIIDKYNSISEKTTNLIDMNSFPKDGYCSDNVHMNEKGHFFVYKALEKVLEKYE